MNLRQESHTEHGNVCYILKIFHQKQCVLMYVSQSYEIAKIQSFFLNENFHPRVESQHSNEETCTPETATAKSLMIFISDQQQRLYPLA